MIQGLKDGQASSETRLIKSIQKAINPFEDFEAYMEVATSEDLNIVISNTTEAGIVFDENDPKPESGLPKTFPGKVTQLLWNRFEKYKGDSGKGLTLIPVELIDKNGEKLKEAILQYADLWQLPSDFKTWVSDSNYFANTLVDRIVPGYPKDTIDEIRAEIGFNDQLVVASEIFHLWVIEGPAEVQKAFPSDEHGFNVIYTNNQAPYRTRKVRVLNGSHTSMVPVGLLHGLESVREAVEDSKVGAFVKHIIYQEDELNEFAGQIIERFKNPFIHHELKSISLNSISKFKVRVLPSLLDYKTIKNELPMGLVTAFAHLVKLYLSDDFEINDDEVIKEFFHKLGQSNSDASEIMQTVLSNEDFWGQDLTKVEGLKELMTTQYQSIIDGAKIEDLLSLDV